MGIFFFSSSSFGGGSQSWKQAQKIMAANGQLLEEVRHDAVNTERLHIQKNKGEAPASNHFHVKFTTSLQSAHLVNCSCWGWLILSLSYTYIISILHLCSFFFF